MTNCHLKSYQQLINKVINNLKAGDTMSVDNFMGKSLCISKNCCILVGGPYI